MKKYSFVFLFLISLTSFSQKYISTTSTVSFYSEAPVEDIKAVSTKGKSIIDISSNEIVFSIAISSFEFDKSLMKEHFNEKYMESEQYPKAIFTGKLVGFAIGKQGTQEVRANGKITIHGVERDMTGLGKMSVDNGKINLFHSFKVRLKDHKIKIPEILWQNIAEEVEVKVNFEYVAYEK